MYTNSKKIESTVERINQYFETKVFNNDENFSYTLSAMNQISESEMDKYTKIMVLSHKIVVPLMKQSLKAIQESIKNGLYIETLSLVEKNQEIILETNQKVKAKLKFFQSVSRSEGFNIKGHTIQDIKSAIQAKENKASFQSALSTTGIAGAGSLLKLIPVRLALVNWPVTAIAMASGYFLYHGLNELNSVKDTRKYIEKLEILQVNFLNELEQFKKATDEQERVIAFAKNILSEISRKCDRFSKIKGFILYESQLAAFNNEINIIINNYDISISFLNMFKDDLTKNEPQEMLN